MRVFIAIRLEEELRKEIGRAQRILRKVVPYGVSFTPLDQLHLTLRFIPEASENQLPRIFKAMHEIAQQVPPFDLSLDSCAGFPPHGLLKSIWATLDESSQEPVTTCHSLCDKAAKELGFEIEEKPYVPHITFARVKRNIPHTVIRETVSKIKLDRLKQRAESLTLFQSDLTVRGAVHSQLHTEPFQKAIASVCAA